MHRRAPQSQALCALVMVTVLGTPTLSRAAEGRLGALLTSLKSSREPSNERLFSVNWWAKADTTEGLPFRPMEPAAPAVDPHPQTGRVFVGTLDGQVHAFDGRGKRLWDYSAGGPFAAGPTYSPGEEGKEGRVFVGTSEGRLVALDAGSGAELWSYRAAEELVTQPSVGDGIVVAVSASDTVFALDEKTGDWKWQYRRDAPGEFTIRGAARPLVLDGLVFAGFADGAAVALQVSDGSVQWARQLATEGQFRDVDADVVADELGRVFFASYSSGVHCLDASSGEVVWIAPRPGVTAMTIDPMSGKLFVGGTGFLGAFLANDGTSWWSVNLGDRFVSGLGLMRGFLMVSTGSGPLYFVEAGTGKLRQSFNPGRGVHAPAIPVEPAGAIVLSNRGYVYDLLIEGAGRP